jgi:protein-S-isoprenylcysteine O-methyltransferase Ste14
MDKPVTFHLLFGPRRKRKENADGNIIAMKNPIRLLLHVPVPWVFVLAYLVGVGVEQVWPSRIHRTAPASVVLGGGAVFLVGAVMAAWCLLIFRKQRTTTVPGRTSAKLVTWGPYRFSRNPMYVSLTLCYLGEAGMLKQAWPLVFLVLTLAYINGIVIPLEETRLREVFGEQYQQFCARVRRWI